MIEMFGGPDRDRTDDLFHAMEARSQLRHRPTLRRDLTILREPRCQVKPRPYLPAPASLISNTAGHCFPVTNSRSCSAS